MIIYAVFFEYMYIRSACNEETISFVGLPPT